VEYGTTYVLTIQHSALSLDVHVGTVDEAPPIGQRLGVEVE